jgi:hypothetical protein
MSIQEEYRKKALECFIAAEGMADPARRLFLLEIAQKWIRMAARLELLEPANLLAPAHRPDLDHHKSYHRVGFMSPSAETMDL